MSINIGDYNFEGPFASTSNLRNESGVYAILGRASVDDDWNVVDIGKSEDVKDRVEDHDRKDCWEEQGYTILNYAACYCNVIVRGLIESSLRQKYDPPCDER